METLKKPEEIPQPDPRNLCWVWLKTGKPVTFSDHYSAIARVQLAGAVPDAVRSYFATVQNLCVYGWFAYDLYSVAAFMSYAMIEMALRVRLPTKGKDRRSFKELLKKAVEDGLIREKAFSRARILGRINDPDLMAVRNRALDELQKLIKEVCEDARRDSHNR